MNKIKLFISIFLLFALSSCAMSEDDPQEKFAELVNARAASTGASRADPGYMQYLERQSLMNDSSRIAQMVSGSNLIWRHPAARPAPDMLHKSQHTVWLYLDPQTLQTPGRSSVLAHLGSPALWVSLGKSGISGLYIAPTGGNGSLWDSDLKRGLGISDDIIQYSLAKDIGSNQEYSALLARSKEHKILLGGDLLPVATGIGPDFILATLNMREYPGLYCVIEVPQNLWQLLPAVQRQDNELKVYPLDSRHVAELSSAGLFPNKLRQDQLKTLHSGWAATGEVRGSDGNLRRWVYRYAYNQKRPILNFNDPSNRARQVMSGSIIFQASILGNSLNAYSLEPLLGLEPEGARRAEPIDADDFTLPLGLSLELSRQIRSYGGYSLLKDNLPLPLINEALKNGPEFALDNIFSPAAEHALLSGNADLLRFMADEGLAANVDWRRLVHASTAHHGISYSLPHLEYLASVQQKSKAAASKAAKAKELMQKVRQEARQSGDNSRQQEKPFYENDRLYTTPAGLAALALKVQSSLALSQKDQLQISRGHMLLQFFKAMQPGIYMPAGQDLTGLMPLDLGASNDQRLSEKRLMPMGSFALLSSAESGLHSKLSLPKAKNLYGSIDLQAYEQNSFLNELASILSLRQQLGISSGTLAGRLKSRGQGVSALVTSLPAAQSGTQKSKKVYAIAICNFALNDSNENFNLSEISGLSALLPKAKAKLVSGDMLHLKQQGKKLELTIPAWSYALILIGDAE